MCAYTPEVTKAKSDKSPQELDARWEQVEQLTPQAWTAISARVSICLDCRGPALLTDEQLTQVIAEPVCTRCDAARRAA